MGITNWRKSLLALALVATAAPVTAASCVAGSVSSYVALAGTGCTVNGLSFSDFAVGIFPGQTSQQIAPATLSIAPLVNGFSLTSASAISAVADQLFGFRLTFDVHGTSLTGGTVAFGPSRSATGDGVLTAFLDAGPSGNAVALVIDGFADTPQSFASSAVAGYVAFLELGIDGGTGGSASLGPELAALTFANGTITPVPEPESALLIVTGLIAVYVRRRRAPCVS